MLIGQLAKRASCSKDTIRHYRELGLLKYNQRSAGSRFYYDFDERSVETIETIRLGKEMGLTLKQMSPLLERFLSGGYSAEQQIQYYTRHLKSIEEKLKSLVTVRNTLVQRIEKLRQESENQ